MNGFGRDPLAGCLWVDTWASCDWGEIQHPPASGRQSCVGQREEGKEKNKANETYKTPYINPITSDKITYESVVSQKTEKKGLERLLKEIIAKNSSIRGEIGTSKIMKLIVNSRFQYIPNNLFQNTLS